MENPSRSLALGIDIDPLFQRVLCAWLGSRGLHLVFAPLDDSLRHPEAATLIVCELADPKRHGAITLGRLARAHPGALRLAISSSFVAGGCSEALARQLGAHAALAKPFTRYDLLAALDAAAAMPKPASHA
jgi:CheY-like chemotaxis protein